MSTNTVERDMVEQFFHDKVSPAMSKFMMDVRRDALAAYDSDTMVAAGFKPFTLSAVKKRWGKVADKLRTSLRRVFRHTATDMNPLFALIDGLLLPSDVYSRTVDVLEQGAAGKWSKDRLVNALAPVLNPDPAAAALVATIGTAVYGIVQQRRFAQNKVPYKKWLSLHDDRVRDTHRTADGQIQLASEPFTVGGALLMFPCDPNGPIGETVNCRCIQIGCNERGAPVADQTALDDWVNLSA